MANHQTSLDIFHMVFNRMPMIEDTPANRTIISNFALELMAELEPCFKVDSALTPPTTHIGDEQYYTLTQMTIVADLICCYILLIFMAQNSGGINTFGSGAGAPIGKFLKRTKAGSVEAEWEAIDIKSSVGMYIGGDKLLAMYKQSAIRKAYSIGCIIDICDSCTLLVSCALDKYPHNFIVQTSCD